MVVASDDGSGDGDNHGGNNSDVSGRIAEVGKCDVSGRITGAM
jgi:hypothetical protein